MILKMVILLLYLSMFAASKLAEITSEPAENVFLSWSIFEPIFKFTILRFPIQSFSHF